MSCRVDHELKEDCPLVASALCSVRVVGRRLSRLCSRVLFPRSEDGKNGHSLSVVPWHVGVTRRVENRPNECDVESDGIARRISRPQNLPERAAIQRPREERCGCSGRADAVAVRDANAALERLTDLTTVITCHRVSLGDAETDRELIGARYLGVFLLSLNAETRVGDGLGEMVPVDALVRVRLKKDALT